MFDILNIGVCEMKKKEEKLVNVLKKQIKSHKKAFAIYVILRVFVILTLVLQLLHKNYENVFLCILTLFLFLLPSFFETKFKLDLPESLEIVILLFIFAAEILGEIQNFYGIFSNWDTILHTINGFLCAAIGFSLIDILNRYEKLHLNLSPLFVAIVGFTFSMTIGVFWEFFEYNADVYFKTDMQKDEIITNISSVSLNEDGKNVAVKVNDILKTDILTKNGTIKIENGYLDIGLHDTMEDLGVNFIGAVVYSIIGYVYVKKRNDAGIAQKFMVRMKNV